MAKSMLIVYETVDRFGRMSEYWKRYVNFYEEYWGGPTSPYGVWFGNEYNDFREKLSGALQVPDEEIRPDFYFDFPPPDRPASFPIGPAGSITSFRAEYGTVTK